MPPRRNKEKFQQLREFERGRIIGLREGGFSYRAIRARVQWNSSTVMQVWKQWTDKHRKTRKTGSGQRKVTSVRDYRHLLRMTVNDCEFPTGSRQHVGLLLQDPPHCKPSTLRLQWAHEPRVWQADCHQVVFSDESRFNLWDHYGRIRVRRSAGERCLPECVMERHGGLTPEIMVWGEILHHGRSNLL
ncbi:transposable element Tc1 transposase [Trichonephila clavipes]|nr:transposable element Tc1 transposase [Trichonephila clavipes]